MDSVNAPLTIYSDLRANALAMKHAITGSRQTRENRGTPGRSALRAATGREDAACWRSAAECVVDVTRFNTARDGGVRLDLVHFACSGGTLIEPHHSRGQTIFQGDFLILVDQ